MTIDIAPPRFVKCWRTVPGCHPTRYLGPTRNKYYRLLVDDDDHVADAKLYVNRNGGPAWTCGHCDRLTRTAECSHTYAAAMRLAEDLLGLTAANTEGKTDG